MGCKSQRQHLCVSGGFSFHYLTPCCNQSPISKPLDSYPEPQTQTLTFLYIYRLSETSSSSNLENLELLTIRILGLLKLTTDDEEKLCLGFRVVHLNCSATFKLGYGAITQPGIEANGLRTPQRTGVKTCVPVRSES